MIGVECTSLQPPTIYRRGCLDDGRRLAWLHLNENPANVFGVLGLCLAVGDLFLDLPHNPATAFLLIAVGLSFLNSHVEKRSRRTGAES